MKAVIPVAGIGKRLRPLTHSSPKALVTVAGKPILGHIVDSLLDMGVTELVPIIGYMGDQIRDYLESTYDVPIHHVVQEEQKGIAHAVSMTRKYVDHSEVVTILGDTIVRTDFKKIPQTGDYVLGVREVEDPRRFGICEIQDGIIRHIVEKPDQPRGNLALIGLYYFRDSSPLFEACEYVIENDIKTKGEYQITDALVRMIESGIEFYPYRIDDWFDCGKVETLLETNRILLEGQVTNNPGTNSIAIKPCYIDPDSIIENSIVGPYVSVAKGCRIENSIIENSILNKNSSISNMVLDGSVVGAGASIIGKRGSLNISDDSEVFLG
ncbi:MAG: NTP transferase domain-containing protein [Candidatus Krumholzibacteriota bacterium]|nr:NTP transferase domain-containing protein [Candidatus Krumholzibacteriota bacterium]